MKKIVISLLTIGTLTHLYSNVNIAACQGCHGMEFEKPAMGKSKIIKDMTLTEVRNALIGYKNGTYGGAMKNIMEQQIKNYSIKDLEKIEIKNIKEEDDTYIPTFKELLEVYKSCVNEKKIQDKYPQTQEELEKELTKCLEIKKPISKK